MDAGNTSDRELLELAAKAVGYDTSHHVNADRLEVGNLDIGLLVRGNGELITTGWNPLTNDDDAMRLAVKLGMSIVITNDAGITDVRISDKTGWVSEHYWNSADAATRRAIVRAAAEIGKAMP